MTATASHSSRRRQCDTAEIKRAWSLIFEPGQITELRALEATVDGDRFAQTYSGYFNDWEKLATAAASIQTAGNIYVIPNTVKPALLARSVNKIRAAKKSPLTSDKDIERRRWLLIDCDPARPAGIASNDAEHNAAIDKARDVAEFLRCRGFPDGIIADSGNGGHVLYRVDEPTGDDGLIEKCLAALQHLAGDPGDTGVKIDVTCGNPARLWKLYGTLSGKGDADAATIGRPQRMARILEAPDKLKVVSHDLLVELAAEVPKPAEPINGKSNHKNNGKTFDLPGWIRDHHLGVKDAEDWQGGKKWVFPTCPFNSAHTNASAVIVRRSDGKIGFKCHHDSCRGNDWQKLREMFEPGYSRNGNHNHHSENDAAPTIGYSEPETAEVIFDPNSAATTSEASVDIVLPTFTTARDLCKGNPPMNPVVIDGLLRLREIGNCVSVSKGNKSWLMMQLAISVAAGIPFLGKFNTTRGDVLMIDNELHRNTLANRLPRVAAAMGVSWNEIADHICIESLRGRLRDIHALRPFFNAIEPGRFSLIILDALYRLLPANCDENSNANMAGVYNAIDGYIERIGSACFLVHHGSKGSQSGKAVTDVGAGAGAQSRACDTHFILRPHREDDVAAVDAAVRSFPPIQPFCVRWDFPRWTLADNLDPTDLREAKPRRKSEPVELPEPWTAARFAVTFLTAEPKTEAMICAEAVGPDLSERKAKLLLRAAVESGLAFKWESTDRKKAIRYANREPNLTEVGGVK